MKMGNAAMIPTLIEINVIFVHFRDVTGKLSFSVYMYNEY